VRRRSGRRHLEEDVADFDTQDMSTSAARATYSDLDRTAEADGNAYELIDGVLYRFVPGKWAHTSAQHVLAELLGAALRASPHEPDGRWRLFHEVELRLSGDALIPDLAAWREPVPPPAPDGYQHNAPPWVCEVLSPSTMRHDWSVKLPAYRRHGVEHVWLLDPSPQQLHVLAVGARGETYTGHPAQPLLLPPFDVPLDLGALWSGLSPDFRG
jgi:Uma2 family endonuclease